MIRTITQATPTVKDLTGSPVASFAQFLARERGALRHWPPRHYI
ncbi:hypothetical protein ACQP1O_33955 [Nocardia sp. CA-151230]